MRLHEIVVENGKRPKSPRPWATEPIGQQNPPDNDMKGKGPKNREDRRKKREEEAEEPKEKHDEKKSGRKREEERSRESTCARDRETRTRLTSYRRRDAIARRHNHDQPHLHHQACQHHEGRHDHRHRKSVNPNRPRGYDRLLMSKIAFNLRSCRRSIENVLPDALPCVARPRVDLTIDLKSIVALYCCEQLARADACYAYSSLGEGLVEIVAA